MSQPTYEEVAASITFDSEDQKERFMEMAKQQAAVKASLEAKPAEKDPIAEASEYVAERWFQQLAPVRTCCFRCMADSPVIFAPMGTLAFGRTVRRSERDITEATVIAFEKIGWRFQKRKSYCPTCKGLGSV